MMAEPANDPNTAREGVLASFDQFVKTGGLAQAETQAKQDAAGGDDEPEPGETESDEQVEAGSESDDEQEVTAEGEDVGKPRAYTVKVDGQDVTVTLEELTAGYSREADYRRKTSAHAESVRQWEGQKEATLKADRDAIAQEREQYKAVLEVWRKQYNDLIGNPQDWDALRRDNPAEWSARMTERRNQLDQLNAIVAEQGRLASEDKTKQDEALKQKVSQEGAKMLEAIPEWKDQSVYLADSRKIWDYGSKIGYAPQELSFYVANDHRAAVVLRDAARYHELQAKKPEAQRKVVAAKPLPPGAAPTNTKASVLDKLRKDQAKRGDRTSTAALFDALGISR